MVKPHGLPLRAEVQKVIITEVVVWRRSIKKMFLKTYQNTQENTYTGVFFDKLQALKEDLQHRCFPVNFAKLLRAPFLQNASEQMLLFIAK